MKFTLRSPWCQQTRLCEMRKPACFSSPAIPLAAPTRSRKAESQAENLTRPFSGYSGLRSSRGSTFSPEWGSRPGSMAGVQGDTPVPWWEWRRRLRWRLYQWAIINLQESVGWPVTSPVSMVKRISLLTIVCVPWNPVSRLFFSYNKLLDWSI